MSKLKNYNEFIYEADDATVQTKPVQGTEINTETINSLFTNLKNAVSKKVEESKKLMSEYYNKTTKDGQEINTTDEFFIYGIYNGNQKVENKKMTFVIKFNEPSESGLTFNVVKSLDVPELKNIDAKEIEVVKKSTDGSVKLNPGFINGRYVVKDKDKVNLLKPKEEQKTEEKPTDSKIDVKVGNVYKYSSKKGDRNYYITEEGKPSGNTTIYNNAIDVDNYHKVPIYNNGIKADFGNLVKYISDNLGKHEKEKTVLENYLKMLNNTNARNKDENLIKEINKLLAKLNPPKKQEPQTQKVQEPQTQKVQEPQTQKVQEPQTQKVQEVNQKPAPTNKPM